MFDERSFGVSFDARSWAVDVVKEFVTGLNFFVSAPIKKLWLRHTAKAVTIRKAP